MVYPRPPSVTNTCKPKGTLSAQLEKPYDSTLQSISYIEIQNKYPAIDCYSISPNSVKKGMLKRKANPIYLLHCGSVFSFIQDEHGYHKEILL